MNLALANRRKAPKGAFFFMAKALAIFCFLSSSHLCAMESMVGGSAVSGLSLTPTATISTGNLIYQLQNRVIGTNQTEGENHSFVVGLTDFSEFGLRTADTTDERNLWLRRTGIRDLSASGKIQLNPLFGFEKSNIKLALGVTDYGGAATNFRSYFAAATYDQPNIAFSLGIAKAVSYTDYNPLNGAFANAAIKLAPWLSVRVETNQRHVWSGFTLTNQSLLEKLNAPKGSQFYLSLDSQIKGHPISGGKPWVSIGVKLPLDWSQTKSTPELTSKLSFDPEHSSKQLIPSVQNEEIGSRQLTPTSIEIQTPIPEPAPGKFQVLNKLAQSFSEMGFEGVNIGSRDGVLVLKFSDFIFDHSALDGAGVALGLISTAQQDLRQLGLADYHLVYARWGTPSMAFDGRIACLSEWLKALNCSTQEAVTTSFRNLNQGMKDVDWVVSNHNSFQYKPRLLINPVYSYYWATDYSLLDYSIGLNIKPYIHLWDGGALEISRTEHVQSSREFEPGRIYSYTRIPSENRRVMLHHMQKLKDGFSARLSVGQLLAGPHRGGELAMRWDSVSGEWAAGVNTAYWKALNNYIGYKGLPDGRPTALFARYAPQGKDWNLEVQAGEYWFKDKGLSVASVHWFGDVNFSYFLRRSIPPEPFWPGKRAVNLAGFEFTFPLTPRKAMKADSFQIKGVGRLSLGLATPIGRPDNFVVGSDGVPVYIRALVGSPIPAFMGSVLLDSDRAHSGYVNNHLSRLRYAYQRWVENAE